MHHEIPQVSVQILYKEISQDFLIEFHSVPQEFYEILSEPYSISWNPIEIFFWNPPNFTEIMLKY